MTMKISLGKLAQQFDLKLIGDETKEITGISTLASAQPQHLAFLANSKYSSQLKTTKAGVVVMAPEAGIAYDGAQLICDDPYVAFAKIAHLFDLQNNQVSGIHETAIIAESAVIEQDVGIGPYCVVGENTLVKSGTVLETRVSIAHNCVIGTDCVIKPHVVIAHGTQIGNRVMIHPGAVIGADGFGLARDKSGWIKVPQLGAVKIGDDCEIGANTTIDRGTIEDTVLANDVRLDNQIQIAHNTNIGSHTVMAGCSATAGSAKIGKNCLIGGGVGILGHLEVCDNVTLQSMALVTRSIKKAGSYSSVSPLQATAEWRKSAVRIKQLDKIAKKVKTLENSVLKHTKEINND